MDGVGEAMNGQLLLHTRFQSTGTWLDRGPHTQLVADGLITHVEVEGEWVE